MDTSFNDSMLLFYTDIRKDKLVKNLGSEKTIREVIETMFLYMDHANKANYSFQKEKKKSIDESLNKTETFVRKLNNTKIEGQFEQFTKNSNTFWDHLSKPMTLDVSDVQAIAYAVGTYQDKRSLLRKMFITENPLDMRISENEQNYENFKKTGFLKFQYLDREIIPSLIVVTNPFVSQNLQADCLMDILKKSCEYMNRSGTLLRLADNESRIHQNYSEEFWSQINRVYEKDDWSGIMARWKNEKLSKKQTKDIAGYFKRQAKVNGILFKALNLTCLKLQRRKNPEETTERVYQEFMNSYRQNGFINAVLNKETN